MGDGNEDEREVQVHDIPEEFDHLIKFVPKAPPEPHTQADHDYINTFSNKFEEVSQRGIKDNE